MCTLATLYSLNSSQITFLNEALAQLQNFAEGTLVIGGDFNVTLSLDIDSTGRQPCLTYSALRRLKQCLFSHQLVDSWRALNPTVKDFTFYSTPHDSYSRIDLFLVKQHDISRVSRADIGSIHISDHAPIMMDLDFFESRRAPFQWRLNKTLLLDASIKAHVEQKL